MKPKLYEYQKKAVAFTLKRKRSALWLEMGLGKSLISLTAIRQMPKPAIVLAPKRVVDHVWGQEIEKFYPDMSYVVLTGSPKDRLRKLNIKADVYVINFELVPWLIDNSEWKYPTVVIDEATKVKNRGSKLFKALRKVAGNWERLIELTGSPAPNGLIDLWSQVYLLDKGRRLGKTLTAFRNRWFKADYMGWSYEPLPHAQKEIEDLCGDICLSMSTADYLDLPKMMVEDIIVDLPPKITKQYKQLKKDLVIEIENTEITAITAAVLSNKLLQLTSGSVYDEDRNVTDLHEVKLEAIDDVISSIGDESLIISYQFKHELVRLRKRYPDGVEMRDRKTSVEEWNAGKIKILFIHPASAGHGINLQHGGRHLVWLTPTWNLEHYVQTNARLHRNGQTKPVMIYRVIADNTIDNHVIATLINKGNVQDALMSALKEK